MEHKTEIYEMGRGEGKTYKMLKMSEELGIPILTYSESLVKKLKQKAYYENINIIEPILLYNICNGRLNIDKINNQTVLIDEIGTFYFVLSDELNEDFPIICTDDIIYFIEEKLGCKIYACTYTSRRLRNKFEKEIEMKNRINNLEKEAKELGYKIIKEEE